MQIGFSDVDGTLLRRGHEVPTAIVADRLRALQERIHVCLCTGRSLQELQAVVKELGLKSATHVFGNGSFVLQSNNSVTSLFSHENSVWFPLVQRLNAYRLHYFALQPNGWSRSFGESPVSAFLVESGALENTEKLRIEFDALLGLHGISFMVVPHERRMDEFYLASELKTVNKGAGIAYVLKQLGISKQFAFGVGDSGNDVSMRPYVGRLYAMNNPDHVSRELHSLADEILPSVDSDGVLVGIDSILTKL